MCVAMSKTHKIVLVNQDTEVLHFDCPENLSIFRGALRAGIEMTAGCMQGRCQICRSTIHAGTVRSLRPLSKYATVDPADLPNNMVLPCSVVPSSDVTLAPRGPWRISEETDNSTDENAASFTLLNPQAMPVWD